MFGTGIGFRLSLWCNICDIRQKWFKQEEMTSQEKRVSSTPGLREGTAGDSGRAQLCRGPEKKRKEKKSTVFLSVTETIARIWNLGLR